MRIVVSQKNLNCTKLNLFSLRHDHSSIHSSCGAQRNTFPKNQSHTISFPLSFLGNVCGNLAYCRLVTQS